MSLEELEARIKMLEDIEEIKKLMASYANWVDAFQMDDVLGLFAENAKAEYGPLGSYEGKDGIATFFKEVVPNTQSWSAHQLLNPTVTVEGEKAKGTWYLFCPATVFGPEGDRAVWIQGRYNNEFVKINGRWKFSLLKFTFNFATPYEEGWVKNRMPEEQGA
jgi:ketosteroid isomerase-like protein